MVLRGRFKSVGENTSTLYQVVGRSGRAENSVKWRPNHMPDNPVIKVLGDGNKEGFLSAGQ